MQGQVENFVVKDVNWWMWFPFISLPKAGRCLPRSPSENYAPWWSHQMRKYSNKWHAILRSNLYLWGEERLDTTFDWCLVLLFFFIINFCNSENEISHSFPPLFSPIFLGYKFASRLFHSNSVSLAARKSCDHAVSDFVLSSCGL